MRRAGREVMPVLRHYWPTMTLDEWCDMSVAERRPYVRQLKRVPPIGVTVVLVKEG